MITNGKFRVIESSDGFSVGEGSNPITPLQFMTKERAEYISHRLNCYEELLEALETVSKCCRTTSLPVGAVIRMMKAIHHAKGLPL